MDHDRIWIRDLRVRTRLGVPDAERAHVQTVSVTLVLEPVADFQRLEDRLERTIDYQAVACRVAELAGRGQRRLAETLAAEVAARVLGEFPLRAVEVTIEKTAVPQAAAVGVWIRRTAKEG